MASRLRASGQVLPRPFNRPYAIFPARKHGYLLPALCLLLFFTSGCAVFSSPQTDQGNGTTNANTSAKITYVAIGASDSFGIGTDDPYNENWPTDLMNLLGADHVHLIDAGIPDILTHDALGLELPIALDAHPDLVTIWLGVNDIAANAPVSNYARDLTTLLSSLRNALPNASIAIANIPDLTLLPYFSKSDPQQLSQTVQQYNSVIASKVQQYRLILVDLTQQNYNLKAHPEYISDDGLHPNEIGYQQLAQLFYEAIQAAQKQATTP
jgi:lysophospholipase L1-like esterase